MVLIFDYVERTPRFIEILRQLDDLFVDEPQNLRFVANCRTGALASQIDAGTGRFPSLFKRCYSGAARLRRLESAKSESGVRCGIRPAREVHGCGRECALYVDSRRASTSLHENIAPLMPINAHSTLL